jgi:hypothetical protein
MCVGRTTLAAALVALIGYAPAVTAQETIGQEPAQDPTPTVDFAPVENETVLAAFVGSSFNSDFEEESVTFGGSLSWLWNRMIGAEFIAGFAPDQTIAPGFGEARVNSYMVNAIAAAPLGYEGQWQPFVSGGLGALTLDSGEFLDGADTDITETELASNIGVGLMAFADRWGFRGDVRYFAQLGDAGTDTVLLNDADFWRANVGVGYRW